MHAFLLGDEGPDAFETVKSVIGRALEEKYYPSFLVSDIYYNFVSHIPADEFEEDEEEEGSKNLPVSPADRIDDYQDIGASTFSLVEADSRPALAEHSTFAQKKLATLTAKIVNKSSALDALKAAQKPTSNVMTGSASSASLASMTSNYGYEFSVNVT